MSAIGSSRGLTDEIYGLLIETIEKWGISHNDLIQHKRAHDYFGNLCFTLGHRKYDMELGKKFEHCDQCHGTGKVEIKDVRELPIAPGKYPCGKCKGTGEIEIQTLGDTEA